MDNEAGRIYLAPVVDAYMIRPYSKIAMYVATHVIICIIYV